MMRTEQYWWIGGVIVVIGLLVGSAAYISGYGTAATSTAEVATSTATTTVAETAASSRSAGAAVPPASPVSANVGGVMSPGASPSSAPYQTVLLQLGATLDSSGVKATPLAVVEDSRCPEGVQCIQAGTVKVSVRFTFGPYTTTRTFTLGQPQTAYGYTAQLTDVRPAKKEGDTISPSDYRFVFVIAKP